MDVPLWTWLATIAALVALLGVDLAVSGRKPHAISLREAGAWVIGYATLAAVFGVGILVFAGSDYAGQFFAGYLTEYSLSVDNLFVFVVIMARFAVPRENQHRVLLVGIVLALLLRGAFIAAGAAVISHFEWVFYIFGAFLLYTAVGLVRHKDEDRAEAGENAVLRLVRRVLPTSDRYDGARLTTRACGRRLFTPMLIVMVAIGTTDLLFALDSIPAIFGLTKEPFLVFTANAFALMGLRQLYFLLGGLLDRLVYLGTGLAVILAFIGVKLILEALHGTGFAWAPQVPIWLSLGVLVGVLVVTTVASLVKVRRDPSVVRRVTGEEGPSQRRRPVSSGRHKD